MDTDRDRDVAMVEVQEENRQLVEEFLRSKMGKRTEEQNGTLREGETGDQTPLGET